MCVSFLVLQLASLLFCCSTVVWHHIPNIDPHFDVTHWLYSNVQQEDFFLFVCLMCSHLPRHPSLSSRQGRWWRAHKWMCVAGGGARLCPFRRSIHYSVGVHMVGDVIRELIAFLLWENGCVIMKSSAMNQWGWGEAPLLMGPRGAIDWWPCVCAW